MNNLKRVVAMGLSTMMLTSTCLAVEPAIGNMGGGMDAMGGMGPMGDMGPGGGMGPMGPMGAGGDSAASSGAESASEFLDVKQIRNFDEVSLLVAQGILTGIEDETTGGYNFQPNKTMTRGEMATILARALSLVNGDEQTGKTTFTDAEKHWAKDYIAYCADKNAVSGMGDGTFQPEKSVTGYEFAAALLKAMGNTGLTGIDWKTSTLKAANDAKMLNGITADLNADITRDDAAKMIYNALTASDGKAALPQVVLCKENNTLSNLTIGKNTVYTAPEGKEVVLTVDGVTKTLDSGTYTGAVVLSVVDQISDEYVSHGSATTQYMTAALSVDETGVRTGESVTAALIGGTYNKTKASDITITSESDYFGGIRVGGEAEYVIENCTFDLTGNGGNDFTGIGCAVSAVDHAKVTVRNCTIYTEGSLRGAFFAGDFAELIVENCEVHTKSLWADENETTLASVNIPTAGMSTPPTGLGVYGNCRSNNVVDTANATYINCKIYADSWGAMGTDDVDATAEDPTYMNLNGCYIEVAGSGYGAYAIGHIWDVLDDTHISVDNGMGVIVAAEGSTEIKGKSVIDSNRFGIVTHQGMGSVSNIVLTDNSTINAKYTGIQIKERATNIKISDGAVIHVTDGAIIHAVVNDDTGAGSLQGSETVEITINNTTLTGDIINSLPNAPMNIKMEKATLTGAISTASYTYLNGGVVEQPQEVGIVTSYKTETLENTELNLTLIGGTWNVEGTSYLTGLTFDQSTTINGTITVDGKVVTAPGTYTGAIVVKG